MSAFVYILRCADGTLYTGYTLDLERRVKQHQGGHGGRYTRTHLPVELVYSKRLRNRRHAMQREIEIKRLPRQRKLKLIESVPVQEMAGKKRTRMNADERGL